MGLDSGTNWLQAQYFTQTMTSSWWPIQKLGALGLLGIDVTHALVQKLDRSVPSSSSRIDHIIMDSRQKSQNAGPRTAIVTGANSGIGWETAKALGRAGYYTILACRDLERGQQAKDRLERQTGLEGRFEVEELDLASLTSVREFVKRFKERQCGLDVLVNNAGVMFCAQGLTEDGLEKQFGTNHVGHFALTMGLLECLEKSKGMARIVVLSSIGALCTPSINYQLLEPESKGYSRANNYWYSKLANLMFGYTLADRLKDSRVTVNVAHPGSIATNLGRHVGTSAVQHAVENVVLSDAMTGALTSIYLALSPEVEGLSGGFYARCLRLQPHPWAENKVECEKLWKFTEELVEKK